MKLKRISVHALPGIDMPFDVQVGTEPIQLVLGPNGIGKSSLCRLIQDTLWPPKHPIGYATTLWDRNGLSQKALLDGAVRWLSAEGQPTHPPVPALELRRTLYLQVRDLLTLDDEHIAEKIVRQITGGYDLSPFVGPKKISGRRRIDGRLETAKKALVRVENAQRQLQEDANQLPDLHQQAGRCRAASQKLMDLSKVEALLACNATIERTDSALKALPPAMKRITGRELEDFDRLRKRLNAQELERSKTESSFEASKQRLEQAEQRSVPQETLMAIAAELAEADRMETAIQNHRQRVRESQRKLSAAENQIDAPDNLSPILSDSLLSELTAAETAQSGAFSALQDLQRVLQALQSKAETANPDKLQQIRRAISILREWADKQRPTAPAARRKTIWATAAVSALLLAAAAYWPYFAILAVLPATLCAYLAGVSAVQKSPPVGAYQQTGVQIPTAWSHEAIRHTLECIEPERIALEDAETARQSVEIKQQELALAKQSLEAATAQISATATQIGLEALPTDARPQAEPLSRRILVWRDTKLACQERKDALKDALADQANLLTPTFKNIETVTGERLETITRAKAAIDNLRNRIAQARECEQTLKSTEEKRQQLEREIRHTESDIRHILTTCKIATDLNAATSRAELAERVNARPQYQSLTQALHTAQTRKRELVHALEDEPGLCDLSATALATEQETLSAVVRDLEPTLKTIATIEERVRETTENNQLEQAQAEKRQAEEEMALWQEQTFRATVRAAIAEYVINTYEQKSRPPLLEKANDFFSAFTHGRYQLKAVTTKNGTASFLATDTRSGRKLALTQLSDGTRIQLIIAARLAYVESTERETRLPLLVDEALTTADPERFNAVAKSLARIAKSRQVFYLTSDPVDVARIKAICEQEALPTPGLIDLAEIRKEKASATEADLRFISQTPALPAPGGKTAAAYAEELRPEKPNLFAGLGQLDLFFLMQDQLDTLYTLRRAQIANVGQYRSLKTQMAPKFLSDGKRIALDAKIAIADCVQRHAAMGHPQPISRNVLRRSEAVSDTFIDPLTDLLRALNGDPARLIEALQQPSTQRDARAKGFKHAKLEALIHFLETRGYLRDEPQSTLSEAINAAFLHPDVKNALEEKQITRHEAIELANQLWQRYGGPRPGAKTS